MRHFRIPGPMMTGEPSEFTAALIAYREGEAEAFDRLVELAYDELKRIAHRQRRRTAGPDAPVQTTALVHETYLRLTDQTRIGYNDRGHFLAAWARAMRQVLVDEARKRAAQKRGGGATDLALDERKAADEQSPELILELNEALERLTERDPRLQRIVECRFFAGFTEPETAEALQMSLRSVQRGWWKARAWLGEDLSRT